YCLSPLFPDGRTEIIVRVALGDTNGPATTEILIFGKIHSSLTTPRSTHHSHYSCSPPRQSHTPKPPQQISAPTQSIGELAANTSIKVKGDDSDVVRRAREVMLHLPNSKPRGRGKEKDKERGGAVFKVPVLPAKKINHAPDADVFGPVSDAKGKARVVDGGIGDIEQENKSIIKKFTVRRLDAVGVSKAHPEFKELFGFVYRGTAFALRATIKKSPVSARALETLVETHIKLHVTPPT
ncbi:hypothetical protein EDB19DRAFT_1655152, partial [Suillus lakei]